MLWCGFYKVIKTNFSRKTVLKIFSQKNWCSIVPHLECVDPECLIFRIRKNKVLVRNSFRPVFHINVQDTDTLTKVYVSISAERLTQIFVAIYSFACLIIQIALLIMWFCGEMEFSFPLFIPVFLFLCIQILTYSSLQLSARHFLKELSNALSTMDNTD